MVVSGYTISDVRAVKPDENEVNVGSSEDVDRVIKDDDENRSDDDVIGTVDSDSVCVGDGDGDGDGDSDDLTVDDDDDDDDDDSVVDDSDDEEELG